MERNQIIALSASGLVLIGGLMLADLTVVFRSEQPTKPQHHVTKAPITQAPITPAPETPSSPNSRFVTETVSHLKPWSLAWNQWGDAQLSKHFSQNPQGAGVFDWVADIGTSTAPAYLWVQPYPQTTTHQIQINWADYAPHALYQWQYHSFIWTGKAMTLAQMTALRGDPLDKALYDASQLLPTQDGGHNANVLLAQQVSFGGNPDQWELYDAYPAEPYQLEGVSVINPTPSTTQVTLNMSSPLPPIYGPGFYNSVGMVAQDMTFTFDNATGIWIGFTVTAIPADQISAQDVAPTGPIVQQ